MRTAELGEFGTMSNTFNITPSPLIYCHYKNIDEISFFMHSMS